MHDLASTIPFPFNENTGNTMVEKSLSHEFRIAIRQANILSYGELPLLMLITVVHSKRRTPKYRDVCRMGGSAIRV